jgi:hypothetical protein
VRDTFSYEDFEASRDAGLCFFSHVRRFQ